MSSKLLKLGKSFWICYSSSFDKLSRSKVSDLLQIVQLSKSYLKFLLLSKACVIPKLLQLEYFPKICCSATLSLAIRWYIVQGSIACHK